MEGFVMEVRNRIEEEWMRWKTWEVELLRHFPESKSVKQEKLDFLKKVQVKYTCLNQQESAYLRILKAEAKQLSKELHKNRGFVRSVFDSLINAAKQLYRRVSFKNQFKKDSDEVQTALAAIGLGNQSEKVKEKLDHRKVKGELNLPKILHEGGRLSFDIFIPEDENGHQRYAGYRATLHLEGEAVPRQITINEDFPYSINSKQAANLLNGKAVYMVEQDGGQGKWVALDLTDKDRDGNFRLKTLPENYGTRIEQQVSRVLESIENAIEMKDAVMARFAYGETVKVGRDDKPFNLSVTGDEKVLRLTGADGKEVRLPRNQKVENKVEYTVVNKMENTNGRVVQMYPNVSPLKKVTAKTQRRRKGKKLN